MPDLSIFDLSGKKALVTGGASGIGRGCALGMAKAGADVAIVDLDEKSGREAVREVEKQGSKSLFVQCDVTDPGQVADMVKQVVGAFGRLDIALNNAGGGGMAEPTTDEGAIETWSRLMDLDLNSVFYCCREEAKVMIPQKYGKIINTASMSAHIVNQPQKQAAYNVSKAGVLHLTRSLATEWASGGIRVNSISPGYTRTKLVQDLLETPEGKQVLPIWLSLTPAARMAEVTDLQGAVVYLAAEVSDFMTGSDLVIDGGYCAW